MIGLLAAGMSGILVGVSGVATIVMPELSNNVN